MNTRFTLWTSLVILGFLLTACQNASEPADSQPDASQGVDSTSAADDFEEEIQISLEVGPGPFFLVERTAGLAELDSYVATLVTSFGGTIDEEAAAWSRTYIMTHVQSPLVRSLSITADGETQAPEFAVLVEMEGMYFEVNNSSCNSAILNTESDDEQFGLDDREPAALLPGVYGAEDGGQVLLGKTAADYYTFDQRSLVEQGISSANGEIWISTDGGYLLMYQLTLSGTEDYFGQGVEGTLTLDYEISDVNTAFPPVLPENCRINAPLMADASNVIDQPDWLAFDTALSVLDVTVFYQEQLPTLGWSELVDPVISETNAFLIYIQEDQNLSISIYSTDNQVTRVSLVTAEIEE